MELELKQKQKDRYCRVVYSYVQILLACLKMSGFITIYVVAIHSKWDRSLLLNVNDIFCIQLIGSLAADHISEG